MKIKNKRRFLISVSILILITIFIIILSNKTFSCGEYETKTIYISNGDTLWSIATIEQINNKYYENKNIREIVQDIKHINKLNDGYIYVGQSIQIPTI